jgi:hypothetical protein
MPQVDFALLCEEAVLIDGLLSVTNAGWDTLVGEAPVRCQVTLAVGLSFSPGECGRCHDVEIFVQGTDGQRIAFGKGNTTPEVDPKAPLGWKVSCPFTINFPLVMPVHGEYSLELLVDGASLMSLQLRLVPEAVESPSPGSNYYFVEGTPACLP